MKGLGKVVPPKREILKDIWLSFFPGAKIGVLGANGAGKSSLLRIMAGVDTEFTGEAWPADGVKIGYLAQEPVLDPEKDVRGNVEEAVAETRALLTRFEDISNRLGEDITPEEMDKLLEEQGTMQDAIDAANAWELDRTIEIAMDALRLPPGDADVTVLSGGERRRVALCRCSCRAPTCCCSTSPPTTSTPRAWPGSSATWPSSPARWWRSPTTATSSTTWPAGSSSSTAARASRSRATTAPGWSRSGPASCRKRSRPARAAGRSSASSSGSGPRPRPATPSRRRACRATRSCSRRASGPRRTRPWRSSSRRGRAWATRWSWPRA